MYNNYSTGGQSGSVSAYGQSNYLEQQQRNKQKRYGSNKAHNNDHDSNYDGAIPSLDGNERNGTVGRSLFAGHNGSDLKSGAMGNSRLSSEDKSSSEYASMRVPQIGRPMGGPGTMSVTANMSGYNSGNVGAGGSIQFGSTMSPSNNANSLGLAANSNNNNNNTGAPSGSGSRTTRRNRSASRQTGSRSRRSRGDGSGNVGGNNNNDFLNKSLSTVDGPVLPHIAGGTNGVSGNSNSMTNSNNSNGIAATGGLLGGTLGNNNNNNPTPAAVAGVSRRHHHHANNNSGVPVNHGHQSLAQHNEEHSSCGVTSIKGLKPGNPNWTNQDNFIVAEQFDNKDAHIYCVLDGHGENGHLASRRAKENFPHHIKAANMDMRRAFAMMQSDLLSSDFDVGCSGATCALAVVANGRLSVSNCGDSRAVLGRRNPNGTMTAHALTYDHKPEKPEERRRILSCGGHLGCRQVVVNQPGKGPVSVPVGPCRVWYQHCGETLGLAMSRSLGDAVVHRCGVSAEPETLEHTLDEYDEFMILATDGVWDVMDNPQVVQMIANHALKNPHWNVLEAANAVARFARSRWEKLSPMIDDITCVVVKLKRS